MSNTIKTLIVITIIALWGYGCWWLSGVVTIKHEYRETPREWCEKNNGKYFPSGLFGSSNCIFAK